MKNFLTRSRNKLSDDAGAVSVETTMVAVALVGGAALFVANYSTAIGAGFTGLTAKITAASK